MTCRRLVADRLAGWVRLRVFHRSGRVVCGETGVERGCGDCLSGFLARNLAVEQARDRGGAAPRWCGVNQTRLYTQPRPDPTVAGSAQRLGHGSALTRTHDIRFPGAVDSRFRPACERCPPAQTHDHCCAPLPPRRAAILALFTHRGTAARRPTHAAPQEPRAAPPPPSHPHLQQQEQE